MRPIIYDKNEMQFDNHGKGHLKPIECVVTEERNGSYEAECEITEKDKHYNDVELGALLGLKVSNGTTQLFRIYKIEKQLEDSIRLYAAHISYDLSYIPVSPIQNALGIRDVFAKWKSQSLVSNPFTLDTDIVSDKAYSMNYPLSARSYLGGTEGSFLDKWHGEYEFDNYDVYLYESRGRNNGVTIQYGKNLTDLEQEDTIEDTADGLLPYWTDGKSYVMGSILRKSNGDKIITVDVTSDFTEEEPQEGEEESQMPTAAEVTEAGRKRLGDLITAEQTSIKVKWYENHEISEVQLCDTVNVVYAPYNINVEMKVTETEWNVLEERYESIILGEYKSFVKTIGSISEDINNLHYNNNQIVIRLERTEDGIEAEVTRAETAETRLSNQITMTAEETKSTIAASVKEWNTSGYTINLYGYDVPTADNPKADEHTGEYYFNQSTGVIYYSNGVAWSFYAQCERMSSVYESEIHQSAKDITQTVAGTFNQYELPFDESYLQSGETITARDKGEPNITTYNPDNYRGYCYLDLFSGKVYRSTYNYGKYVWTYIQTLPNINVTYGIGSPNTESVDPFPSGTRYVDQASGNLYISDGSSWSLDYTYSPTYPNPLEKTTTDVKAELSTRIEIDDDRRIVSLITGSADKIHFNANNLFTVTAPNFSVDDSGLVTANNIDLQGVTNFKDANNNDLGYIGTSVLGGGGYGIGLRNASDNTGIAFANYGDGYLWFKSNNNTMVLASSLFRPATDGGIDLGSSNYHWDWVVCNHISCVNPPWSTSDKRLKNVKGYIDSVKNFYMALKPIEYTFKEGVAYEDTEKMHYGLIAQDVLKEYEKCYNTDKQGIVKREEVLEDSTKELLGEDYKYSINYDELHAFHIKMIQSLVEEVQALKDENNRLSAKIDEIERRIK